MLVDSVFSLLSSALGIWNSKEKTKYLDRLIYLKKAYYEEFNKPEGVRDNAVLDNLRFELKLLCDGTSSALAPKQDH